jgi:hypothetical protein
MADAFFTGLFTTALEDGEVITKVAFPEPARAGYEKFPNPASRYAMTGVFVSVAKGGEVRVAVTGAGNKGVFRSAAMEKALTGNFSTAAIQGVTIDAGGMLADLHACRVPGEPGQGDGGARDRRSESKGDRAPSLNGPRKGPVGEGRVPVSVAKETSVTRDTRSLRRRRRRGKRTEARSRPAVSRKSGALVASKASASIPVTRPRPLPATPRRIARLSLATHTRAAPSLTASVDRGACKPRLR